MKSIEYFRDDSNNFEDTIFSNEHYSELNKLLIEYELEERREKWNHYNFNGFGVPRATEIISSTIGKEYLNKWAAKLGENYNKYMNIILDTGTLVHEMIDDYILFGKIKSNYDYKNADQIQVMKAYHNFVNFWTDMRNKGYKIEPLAIEVPFATPWYGGTIDFIAYITPPNSINKKLYILDFKTSKNIIYNYFIQLTLYAQAYEDFIRPRLTSIEADNPYTIQDYGHIDGIGVIRVDKNDNKYEYIFVDMDIDREFIYNLSQASASMINWYYHMNFIDLEVYSYKKEYIERGGIDGIYRRSNDNSQ